MEDSVARREVGILQGDAIDFESAFIRKELMKNELLFYSHKKSYITI